MTESGYHISPDGTIYFKAVKEYKVNTDWTLSLDDVAGIANCNAMYGDWDSDFLVIFRKDGTTIYHMIGGMIGLPKEQTNFDQFWELLIERFGVPSTFWEFRKNDSTVLLYPTGHETEPVYWQWNESWAAFKFALKQVFDIKHCASGLLRPEMRAIMGL